MLTGVYEHKPLSLETKRKISEANKGHIVTEETRKKISLAHKGKIVIEETKRKLSESHKGEKNYWFGKHHSEEQKRKISESEKGKIVTEETKRKLSESHKGLKLSKETKEKLSLAGNGKNNPFYGKKHSEETKRKMRGVRAKQTLPTKDTKIEVKIQNFLKKLGIEFFTHQYMSQIKHAYQCDILIPYMNLVIECDGDYWHKYPIGNDIDHIRTKELIKKGFKVLRLWEFEINEMSIKGFENRLGNLK